MANALLDKIRKGDFSDIEGASLSLRLPLTRALLNRNLEQLPVKNIRHIQIESISGKTVRIHIKTALLLSLNITVEVQDEMDLPWLGLRMKITDGLGRMARSMVDTLLPDGMSITDGTVYINLRHFLFEGSEYGPLLDKITRAAFAGGDDKLFLELELKL